jgi:hypothetical protein
MYGFFEQVVAEEQARIVLTPGETHVGKGSGQEVLVTQAMNNRQIRLASIEAKGSLLEGLEVNLHGR